MEGQATACEARGGEEADSRLRRWVDTAAGGNAERFAQRLRCDGWSVEQVRPLLGPVRWACEADLPAWTAILQWLTRSPLRATSGWHTAGVDEIPFAPVLSPLVARAVRRLRAAMPPRAYSRMAVSDAAHHLHATLGSLCAPALWARFSADRSSRSIGLTRALTPAPPDSGYQAFVASMLAGGLRPFFWEYPVLARLVADRVAWWVQAYAELAERFVADRSRFAEAFDVPPHPELRIARLRCGLSDPHRQGRSVCIVGFATGHQVVYKPRSVDTERQYFDLVRWHNTAVSGIDLRAPRVVARPEYGWVEYVSAGPCRSHSEAVRYFQRLGSVLALHHALGGSDLHQGNVVAAEDQPVVVDSEVLLRAALDTDGGPGPEAHVSGHVLQTGLFADWSVAPDGTLIDSGAMAVGGRPSRTRRCIWRHINTDRMCWENASVELSLAQSTPTLWGRSLLAEKFVDDVVIGFEQTYDALTAARDTLFEDGGPLREVGNVHVRLLVRDTALYARTEGAGLHPSRLRDGVDRCLQLEAIARPIVEAADLDARWPLVRAELRALERGDIPAFQSRAASQCVHTAGGEVVPGLAVRPAVAYARSQLRSLGPADKAVQVALLRASVVRKSAPMGGGWSDLDVDRLRNPPSRVRTMFDQLARAEARRIAAQVREALVDEPNGGTFVAFVPVTHDASAHAMAFADPGLSRGRAGVALFLAAVAHVEDDAGAGTAARMLLQPLLDLCRDPVVALQACGGIGVETGLGGMAYALARAGALLHDPTLLDTAVAAADAMTTDAIKSDTRYDIMQGTAGAILALLTVHTVTEDGPALARAVVGAEHLAAVLRGWVGSPDARNHSACSRGFARGLSGIAHSLTRVAHATGDRALAAASRLAFDLEARVPDQGGRSRSSCTNCRARVPGATWCCGAPGVALARVAALSRADGRAAPLDLRAVLDVAEWADVTSRDHLCGGTFGRVAALSYVAAALDRPDLRDDALEAVARALAGARRRGQYACHGGVDDRFCPGFFEGTAGIGYELLRLAHPGRLPLVLLFE